MHSDALVTWKQFFVLAVPTYLAAVAFPIVVLMWMMTQHNQRPHEGTVLVEQYLLDREALADDMRELRLGNRELIHKLEELRKEIHELH